MHEYHIVNMSEKEKKEFTQDGDMEHDVSIDIEASAEDDVEAGAFSRATEKKLREKLKKCTEEKQEYLLGWQRMRADFVNTQKQSEKNAEIANSAYKRKMIGEFIPVLDSFDMAMINEESWMSVSKNWRMGVEYIHSQLLGVLRGMGMEEIRPARGDAFDMNIHMAVAEVEGNPGDTEGTVAEVTQKGYKVDTAVIRPASVKVVKSASEPT